MFQTKFTTDSPPDSIEWCPVRRDVFACGTYLYNPENTTRQGSIYLLQYNSSTNVIDVLHQQSTDGILDLKWMQSSSDTAYLSTVTALGQLSLYLSSDFTKPTICEDVTNDQAIALSHEWLHATNNYVVISDQHGYLTICELDNTNGLRFTQSWLAHEYECWTCAWDKHDANIVYSGADDALFKIWDVRDYKQAAHVNRKHNMGICSIVLDENNQYELLTGSFDEYLRQWDKRQMNQALKEIKLGGGVWKIKPHPLDHSLLLCACMQNGFVIVDLKSSSIRCHYKEHGSLAYGCDWQYNDSMNQLTDLMDVCMNEQNETVYSKDILSESLIATCSFYDKIVHIWKCAT